MQGKVVVTYWVGGCAGENTKFSGCLMKNKFYLQTLEHPDRIKHLATLEYPTRIWHLAKFSLYFYIRFTIYLEKKCGGE